MPSGASTWATGVMEEVYQPIETSLGSWPGLLAAPRQGTGQKEVHVCYWVSLFCDDYIHDS